MNHRRTRLASFILVSLLSACANSTTPDPVGGETHFLAGCDEGACGVGLECVCGVCTQPCTTDNTCKDLSALATCEAAGTPNGACANPQANPVCDVACSADMECHALGDGYSCEQGSCRKLSAGACAYDGVIHADDDRFAVECSTCICSDGDVACSDVECRDGGMDASDSAIDASDSGLDSSDDDAGEALACLVGAVTYAHGTTNVPDPNSCGSCRCEDGDLLACAAVNCTPIPLPECHPLHHVVWHAPAGQMLSGYGGDVLSISRAGVFERTPLGMTATCRSTLPACDGDLHDAANLNAALLHPDVIEALRVAPSYYPGPNNAELTVEVDGRSVRFGVDCEGSSCIVPAGLVALGETLKAIGRQQHCATEAECLMVENGGPCEDGGIQRFVYDADTNSCRTFQAYCGGLGGNANNFATQAACLASCEMPPDPITCLEGDDAIYDGSLVLLDATAAMALRGIRHVTGDIEAPLDTAIIDQLECLERVDGTLILRDGTSNHARGMQSLVTVGRELWIENTLLSDLDDFAQVETVGGLMLHRSSLLSDISAVADLMITRGISIVGCSELTSVDPFAGLTTLPVGVTLMANAKLTSLTGLADLVTVGALVLSENPLLTSLAGLENVQTVGLLQIAANPLLSDIGALEGVLVQGPVPPESQETMNRLTIYNNPSLDLCTVTQLASEAGIACSCPPNSTPADCVCTGLCECTGNDNTPSCI